LDIGVIGVNLLNLVPLDVVVLNSVSVIASMVSPAEVDVQEATKNMFHVHHAANGVNGACGVHVVKHVEIQTIPVLQLELEHVSTESVLKAKLI
jgi:hypothetical protein